MALADILNVEDADESRMTLTRVFHTLVAASEDYAKSALEASSRVLAVAREGGTCAEVYKDYASIGTLDHKARKAQEHAHDLMEIMSLLNESDDDEANMAYDDHLHEMSKINEVSALLDGTATRMGLIKAALPDNPMPAARFDSSVFKKSSEDEQ